MLVSFSCLKKLLLLLLCIAGFGHADNLYLWPDTNFASEENWSKGRPPCAGEQVDLSSSTFSPLVTPDVPVELAADSGLLILPTSATLVLEDGFALTSTVRGEPFGRCAGEPEPNRFLPPPRREWLDPGVWCTFHASSHKDTGGSDAEWTTGSGSMDESGFRSAAVWTRDAWRGGGRRSECIRFGALVRSLTPLLLLPCAHDAALLPPNSTVLLSLTSPLGRPPEVGRLLIDSTPHTTSSFAELLKTDLGKLQFSVAPGRPRPLTINVEPSRCPSCLRTGCHDLLSSASTSALCARYNLSTCPAATAAQCPDSQLLFQPAGACCPICGDRAIILHVRVGYGQAHADWGQEPTGPSHASHLLSVLRHVHQRIGRAVRNASRPEVLLFSRMLNASHFLVLATHHASGQPAVLDKDGELNTKSPLALSLAALYFNLQPLQTRETANRLNVKYIELTIQPPIIHCMQSLNHRI